MQKQSTLFCESDTILLIAVASPAVDGGQRFPRNGVMSGPIDKITISEDGPKAGRAIRLEFVQALRSALAQAENASFVLSARDSNDALIGGVTASASYGWLKVEALWVAEHHHHQGLGRSLMEHAEERGRAIDCHGAWLDTSNPDAKKFYAKLGSVDIVDKV